MNRKDLDLQPNRTLARALLVLEAFSADQPEWGVRELGRALGLNPTTIYRLVATLQNAGYLEQDPDTQKYALGPKVLKLASVYTHRNPLPAVARRVFEAYTDRFEYNFYLGTLSRYEMIYLAVLDGRGPIRIEVDAGGTSALHSTALGKVLLAHQEDAYIQGFLESNRLAAYTSRSITDPQVLRRQLKAIRDKGYAFNDGEHFEEVGAVGVPVYDRQDRVHLGVSLAYPRHFAQEGRIRVTDLIPLAQEIASEIALRIESPYQGSPSGP